MLNNNSKISGDFNVNKKVDIWQAGPSTEHYPQFLTSTVTLTWPGSWHGMTTTRAASSSSHPIIFPNIFFPSRHFWGYLTPRTRMMTEREVSEECRVRPDKFRGPGHYPARKQCDGSREDRDGANLMSGNGGSGCSNLASQPQKSH